MGTDIRIVVEKKISDRWVAYNTLSGGYFYSSQKQDLDCYDFPVALDRNYQRFAALAGVRGEGPAPLGFPEDASETSKLLWNEGGGHSPSWMDAKRAASIFSKTDASVIRFTIPDPEEFYFDLGGLDLEEFRIVFWFDS